MLIVVALAITLIAINPAKQFEEAEQKASTASSSESQQDLSTAVGRHAYNKINGAYRGEILEVKQCSNVPELNCYVVNQPTFMRPMEAPVDNSVVKDEAPTPNEQP